LLTEPKTTYVVEYPEAVAFAELQQSVFWPYKEINVEKDVHDILTNLTDAEKHGVITTLKLFTQYELIIGDEYWNSVGKMFNKPADVHRMTSTFSFFELGVHAPFYSKINEALGLATDSFYNEYTEDPVLDDKIRELHTYADPAYPPRFLMALALAEGVTLYSSFAFLKHFQSQGKNKILNIVRGINFSSRDEAIHSDASAWLFRTYLEENGLSASDFYSDMQTLVGSVRESEHAVVDKIFEKGRIDGITDVQMKHFIDSRINLVLKNLGFQPMFEVPYNPIADWFYDGINGYSYNDFFSGIGNQYVRDWDEGAFTWD
jgi:ribonucleotide reductase beta subunit family protein with ferritin-like domain